MPTCRRIKFWAENNFNILDCVLYNKLTKKLTQTDFGLLKTLQRNKIHRLVLETPDKTFPSCRLFSRFVSLTHCPISIKGYHHTFGLFTPNLSTTFHHYIFNHLIKIFPLPPTCPPLDLISLRAPLSSPTSHSGSCVCDGRRLYV